MTFTRLKSDSGIAVAAVVMGVGSLLAGGAAATAAIVAVVDNYGPQDSTAVQDGPKDVLQPDDVLSYGG
ncbi:hypothetical protein GCM10027446_29700 [Angustibacter peucedani]